MPRGQLGLAYDDVTAPRWWAQPAGGRARTSGGLVERAGGRVGRRRGRTRGSWTQPFTLAWTEQPERVGRGDVGRLTDLTMQLRAIDHEHGGGACRDAVLAQVAWAQRMLRAQVAPDAEHELHLAVADLHLLAGWTSFDLGLVTPARRHFARALEHARFVDETVAGGQGALLPRPGPRAPRLGRPGGPAVPAGPGRRRRSPVPGRAVAMVQANLGWAYALAGDARQALASIDRAREEYARSEHDQVPGWIRFFDSAELQALRGTVLAHLPTPTPAQRAEAIERFSLSTALRELPLARSRAFELTALAWLLLERGRGRCRACRPGHQAVDLADADPVAPGDRPDGSAEARPRRSGRPTAVPSWPQPRRQRRSNADGRWRRVLQATDHDAGRWTCAQRLMSPSVAN